jgi:hypothetical protein
MDAPYGTAGEYLTSLMSQHPEDFVELLPQQTDRYRENGVCSSKTLASAADPRFMSYRRQTTHPP